MNAVQPQVQVEASRFELIRCTPSYVAYLLACDSFYSCSPPGSFDGNQLTGTLPSAVALLLPVTSPELSSNCITGCTSQYVGCGGVERPALVDLYVSTSGIGWKNSTNWLTNTSYCSWFGVSCVAGSVMYIPRIDLVSESKSVAHSSCREIDARCLSMKNMLR